MNSTILSAADINRFFTEHATQTDRRVVLSDDADLERIEASGVFTGITDRDSYLRWTAAYKAWIKAMESHIRALKAEIRKGEEPACWLAQSRRHHAAEAVNRAILLRRLSRRWSAAQRQRLAAAA